MPELISTLTRILNLQSPLVEHWKLLLSKIKRGKAKQVFRLMVQNICLGPKHFHASNEMLQLFTVISVIIQHIGYKDINSNQDSSEKRPKSSLEQMNLEGKLNGKWGQYEFTKFRILCSFLGLQNIGRKIMCTLVFTPLRQQSSSGLHQSASWPQQGFRGIGKQVNTLWTTETVKTWILTEATPK